jgi:ribosome-binding factor A
LKPTKLQKSRELYKMVYRYSKPPSQRQLRVSNAIHESLSKAIVKNDFAIPFFDHYNVSISKVKVSADLKLVTVFMLFPENAPVEEALKWLNDNIYLSKKFIAESVNLKFVPKMRYVKDEEYLRSLEIEEAFSKLSSTNNE